MGDDWRSTSPAMCCFLPSQLVGMAFVTVIFAGLGVFSPSYRGSLLQVNLAFCTQKHKKHLRLGSSSHPLEVEDLGLVRLLVFAAALCSLLLRRLEYILGNPHTQPSTAKARNRQAGFF